MTVEQIIQAGGTGALIVVLAFVARALWIDHQLADRAREERLVATEKREDALVEAVRATNPVLAQLLDEIRLVRENQVPYDGPDRRRTGRR